MNKMNHIKHTDLDHLRVIADWLADDHELPSTNDAACVMDAIDEIERLRKTLEEFNDMKKPNGEPNE